MAASSSDNTSDNNAALVSVPLDQRVFAGRDHGALWFSLGVGLLVMQVGAYLVPGASTRDAVWAIVLGSLLGSALLAWAARLGCDTGLGSAGLMHHAFGKAFASLPVLLNIVQLMGWTTFELVVMRDGTQAIGTQSFGYDMGSIIPTLVWGAVLLALLSGSMTQLVRHVVGRYALPLVVASLLWLTWQFGSQLLARGWEPFWAQAGDGSMGLPAAMDLVISMPVSWLPLVADYARFGKSGRSTWNGTFAGYALANIWCFALGLAVVTVAQPQADLVTTLLLAQGGLLALSFILIDEIDNAYGDVYSGAVSTHSLLGRLSIRSWGMVTALACTGLALVLPMHSLEPFLLMLSSVFVPLFGVILGRLWGNTASVRGEPRQVHWGAAGIWLAGIAVYHGVATWAPAWGATLPALVFTWVLARATRAR